MKKFVEEVFKYFWIPLIIALVTYIFFQLNDVVLGISTLVALSAVYTIIRLYFTYKKWWLLIILVVVVFISVGSYFLLAPDITLEINGQKVTGASISLNEGSVSISPLPQTNGLYKKNTVVTLIASPETGFDWKSWAGTDNDAINPTTVTMGADKKVSVNFQSRFSLVINNQLVIGSLVSFSEGSVTVDPPPEGDGKYQSGTEIVLTARAVTGYDWTAWDGTDADTANPTKLKMDGNEHITVTFSPRFSLTISNQTVIGDSASFPEGLVNISPAPGDDGKYASGTKVTLTAVPFIGYGWKYWSGTSNDSSNPATITINSDKLVAVTFEPRYLVNINGLALTGPTLNVTGGTVSANPAPGADGRYSKDDTAVLTASPASGYRFDHWGGDTSGQDTSLSLVMNTGKNITVTFIKTFTLAVSNNPSAAGSVSPGGGTYDEGTTIKLTVTAASGYRFDHWSGDVSGNITSVTIVMDSDKTVTADFVKMFTLTVTASPVEGGSVLPAGGVFDDGAVVTLTAVPASGFTFDHWTGDVSGNTTTISVNMNDNKNATAVFLASP